MKSKLQEMVEGIRSMEVGRIPDYPLDDIGIAKLFHSLCKGVACYVPEENKCFTKYTTGLQGRKHKESILKDACSIAPRILSDFDSDKLLFNCQNGPLNLST